MWLLGILFRPEHAYLFRFVIVQCCLRPNQAGVSHGQLLFLTVQIGQLAKSEDACLAWCFATLLCLFPFDVVYRMVRPLRLQVNNHSIFITSTLLADVVMATPQFKSVDSPRQSACHILVHFGAQTMFPDTCI